MKTMRPSFLLAVIAMAFSSVATAQTQQCGTGTASTYETVYQLDLLARYHRIVAVADWTGDGRDDLVVFPGCCDGNHADDRRQADPLSILLARPDNTYERPTELGVEAYTPIVLVEDFNQDGTPDMAVFDAGVYSWDDSTGYGNPPQLLLSDCRSHHLSAALADAVAAHRDSLGPDLHLKSATTGDIDNDGDLDIWVESTGGHNVESHFIMNEGSGVFSSEYRIDTNLKTNRRRGELWRYDGAALVDLDGERGLDLVLGQIRDPDPTHENQYSIVLENEGTGDYGWRHLLPHPDWYDGYTSVPHLTHHALDGDGLQDLILVHQRNDARHAV